MNYTGRKDTAIFFDKIEHDNERAIKRLQQGRSYQANQLIKKARVNISKSNLTMAILEKKRHINKIEVYVKKNKYLPSSFKSHLDNIISGKGIYEGLF